MSQFSVGIVGATGLVGTAFLGLLKKRRFPVKDLRLFASDKSVGQKFDFAGKKYSVMTLAENCFAGLDIVFFSSGDDISAKWAPQAARAGAIVIDNSAAFRMDVRTKLIVPEINGSLLERKTEIIANPNCSTIQLAMCLAPLDKHFGVSEVRVATYQSVSGAGRDAVEELQDGVLADMANEEKENKVFPRDIAFNTIPQIGSFGADGFSSEETKIIKETKKILGRGDLKVSAFTVRVPTLNGHAEVAWITLKKKANKFEFTNALRDFSGVKVHDGFPTVKDQAGNEFVHVGRIHEDLDFENTWIMWIVCDNLLKGAALNGIQIAEKVLGLPGK